MSLKRILTVVLLFLLTPVAGLTQDEQPGLVVRTTPPGALVTLEGESVVTGISPVLFSQGLGGFYQLKVEKQGFETHEEGIILDPGRRISVDVVLSEKSRLKAAARSVLIPGWGQIYADQKGKGFLFGVLAVGSVTAFLIAEDDFKDKEDHFNGLVSRWDSTAANGSIDELRRLRPQLMEAQDDAYDAENIRRATIGTVIGVWSLAVLDAIFFFPDEGSTIDVKGLSLEPNVTTEEFGFTLTKRF